MTVIFQSRRFNHSSYQSVVKPASSQPYPTQYYKRRFPRAAPKIFPRCFFYSAEPSKNVPIFSTLRVMNVCIGRRAARIGIERCNRNAKKSSEFNRPGCTAALPDLWIFAFSGDFQRLQKAKKTRRLFKRIFESQEIRGFFDRPVRNPRNVFRIRR